MRRVAHSLVALALFSCLVMLAAYGCGGGSNTSQQQTSSETPPTTTTTTPPAATSTPAETSAAAMPAKSPYDEGPRAGQAPVVAALATSGEKLFQTKGCPVCHGFGKVVQCPDLVGVSMRRTASWMEHQILHPELMVNQDPISHELRTHYKLPMTNQGLSEAEAKAVVEFLKKKDKDANVAGVR